MTPPGNQWRDRYYALEGTLEVMFEAFAEILEEQAIPTPSSYQPHIEEVIVVDTPSGNHVCCAARGESLRYAFRFQDAGKPDISIGFGPLNSSPIPPGYSSCEIQVKNNAVVSGVWKEESIICTVVNL